MDQIGVVLKRSQFKSTRKIACMTRVISVLWQGMRRDDYVKENLNYFTMILILFVSYCHHIKIYNIQNIQPDTGSHQKIQNNGRP